MGDSLRGEERGYEQYDGKDDPNAMPNHRRGAAGECAACKWADVQWPATVNTFKRRSDIGNGVEVRSHGPDCNYMRVKIKDKAFPNEMFISVKRLGNRKFEIEGGMRCKDACIDKYFQPKERHSGRPEWCVPVGDLIPPSEELRNIIRLASRGGPGGMTRYAVPGLYYQVPSSAIAET